MFLDKHPWFATTSTAARESNKTSCFGNTSPGHNMEGKIPCYFKSQMSEFVPSYSISMTTCGVVEVIHTQSFIINTLRLTQNGCHFADNNFIWSFLNENVWISIKISLKFFSKGPITKYSIIGSYNGLAPTRWQAIIWTNADHVYWHMS